MDGSRNSTLIKNELIRYISSLGLTVNTVTKARGNRGFFKEGRIDVSKIVDDKSAIRVLIHEFAHYINYKLDKSLSSLTPLFGEDTQEMRDELIAVTMFVDKNSQCIKLIEQRESIKQNIKTLTDTIQKVYPDFSSSEDFKEFKKYARGTNLKYLEKYDRVRINTITSNRLYTIENVKEDFPDIPDILVDYLKLKSELRKRSKVTRRISKLNKYYNEPCELFARFIEGIYSDIEKTKELAPTTFEKFLSMHNKNHYKGLREIFGIVRVIL